MEKTMAPHSSTLAWKIQWTGSDMTERLHFHFSLSCIGEGNGNPLQWSCLENPRDGGAWWAAVSGVTQSRTRLKWLSSSSSMWRNHHVDGTERDMLQFVVYWAESGNDVKWTTEELDSERAIWQLLQELQKKKAWQLECRCKADFEIKRNWEWCFHCCFILLFVCWCENAPDRFLRKSRR